MDSYLKENMDPKLGSWSWLNSTVLQEIEKIPASLAQVGTVLLEMHFLHIQKANSMS